MRLQTPGFSSLHLFSDRPDLRNIHCVPGKRPPFDQLSQAVPIYSHLHHLEEARLYIGLVAVADCLHKQLTQARFVKQLA